jgi:hypothetical protein
LKAKLLFAIFIVAAICWSLIVIMVGTQHGFILQPYLDSPWSSGIVGILGGFMIVACGLRLYSLVNTNEFLRRVRNAPRHEIATHENYSLDSCQTMYREPYIVTDQRAAR